MIKYYIDEYNIEQLAIHNKALLSPSIEDRVDYIKILDHINEAKVLADSPDMTTLVVWPYDDQALTSRLNMLEAPRVSF